MAHDAQPSSPLAGRTATVVTASDGVTHGTREDTSGTRLATILARAGATVADRVVVPDDVAAIAGAVTAAVEVAPNQVVVITGGTGLGPRDVTPEALELLADRDIPGFGEAMRAAGRRVTPLADLSRSLGVAVGTSLVVAVPGSPTGAAESLEAVLGLVPHVLDLLAGDTAHTSDDDGHDGHDHDGHDHDDPDHEHGPECEVAHGHGAQPDAGTLMAVFASPLAAILLAWGRELGYEVVLVDPERAPAVGEGLRIAADTSSADATTDIVVTDHHRDELVDLLDVALDTPARFIGLMGSRRHEGPHVQPLTERGRTPADLARITRPIGLDIGSRTPAEIAVATLADLVARRTGRRP
jgi:molybdenum cofactor synthesis domain-containing protein